MPTQSSQSSRICVLPTELANQIAAGEVVERPASVVKELVENSLDAGATRITVTIQGGGRRLISVLDNGCGMNPEEARLSLERHATSKVRTLEDLTEIETLGFRGEALPSIASVSRFSLTTRTEGDLEGVKIGVVGGDVGSTEPVACTAGTEIEVRDLFFNTPARLKFLKTEMTERRHIAEAMTRVALSKPDVHVKLVSEGRTVIDAAPCIDLKERVSAVLGTAVADQLFPVKIPAERGNVTATGLFSSPKATKRNSSGLYTFVNGRFVRDKRIIAAIRTGYSGLLDKGVFPTVGLYIDLPANEVDVNVHPAKTEVRFHQPDMVFRAVRAALVEGLAEAPWVPGTKEAKRVYTLDSSITYQPGDEDTLSLRPTAGEGDRGFEPVQETLSLSSRLDTNESLGGWWTSRVGADVGPQTVPRHDYFNTLSYLGKLGTTYLLCQDGEGLVVVDQHAAHERITFEGLKAIYSGNHRQIQSLLIPIQLELDPVQVETMREHTQFFETMGFEIDLFSDDTFVVRAVPALLLGASYQRLLRDALDEIAVTGHSDRLDEAVEAVLSRMACHGSVRAGDRMMAQEVEELLRQMDQIDFRGNCPHGRPVYFQMDWAEIEKRFERR